MHYLYFFYTKISKTYKEKLIFVVETKQFKWYMDPIISFTCKNKQCMTTVHAAFQ